LAIAIGTILCLGGLFLALAAHQILPHGINAISHLGVWGQTAAYSGLGLGCLFILLSAVKWHCNRKNDHAHVDNGDHNRSMIHDSEERMGKKEPEQGKVAGNKDKRLFFATKIGFCTINEAGLIARIQQEWTPISFNKEGVEQGIQKMCDIMKAELADWWEVLSEAQQTVLALYAINRREGLLLSEAKLSLPTTDGEKAVKNTVQEEIIGALLNVKQGQIALSVTASKDQIIDIYLRYNRLILLRPLQSDSLMIGCGWGKCGLDQASQPPVHQNVDSVNILLEQNPSAICFWGDEQQCAFFEKRYKFIYDEGPVVSFLHDQRAFYQCCKSALQSDDSYIILGNHLFKQSTSQGLFRGFTQEDIDKVTPPISDFEHVQDPIPLVTYRYEPRIYRLKKNN